MGPWWNGRPSGIPILRGCGEGLLLGAYSRASAGVKRNPTRHASAWKKWDVVHLLHFSPEGPALEAQRPPGGRSLPPALSDGIR
jgi:hypothetical protein